MHVVRRLSRVVDDQVIHFGEWMAAQHDAPIGFHVNEG
jgi:hypothetical protein